MGVQDKADGGAKASPAVTCVMPTMQGRREWIPKAIRCFQQQTYPARKLLIVADSESDIEGLIPLDDHRITAVWGLPRCATLGEKRNLCCSMVDTPLVAHNDDDDWYGPGRLADQVERLEASGKAVMGYRTMRFTDGAKWWLYSGAANYAMDPSLLYRVDYWRNGHRFEHRQVGFDNAWIFKAAAEGQLVTAEAGEHMYMTVHAHNTSPRKTVGNNWKELAAVTA